MGGASFKQACRFQVFGIEVRIVQKKKKRKKKKCDFCLVALKATVNVMCASLLHNLIFICLRSCLGTGFRAIVLSLCLPFLHLFQWYNAMARMF